MTEETAANPAEPALDADNLLGAADDADLQADVAEGSEQPDEEAAEGDDAEGQADDKGDEGYQDVEIDGVTYSVPKKLAAERMMHADYTRKTMEVAATRKALDTDRDTFTKERQAFVQQAEAERAFGEERAKIAVMDANIASLNAQIGEYGKVDWSQLDDATHTHHSRVYNELVRQAQALTQERDGAARDFTNKVQAKALEAQQETAKRRQEGVEKLPSIITGWNDELADKTANFALSEGLTLEEIRSAPENPVHVKMLYLAMLGAESLKQKAQVKRIAPAQKTAPVKSLRGAAGKFEPAPDTNDFAAFERMADEKLKAARR